MAVVEGEDDPRILARLKRMGINTIVTSREPSLKTALATQAAGLSYLSYISTAEALRLAEHPASLARVSAVAAVKSFAGFHFLDETVPEGYTSPLVQERVYRLLKDLFPSDLSIHALRLDLVALDPTFLDGYFRPEFTDLVVPYFYPVGTTVLGNFQYVDDWDLLIVSLLEAVRDRMSAAQEILPVLQGFEQVGFPLEIGFARRQMNAYRLVWPSNAHVAAFVWGFRDPEGLLIPMDDHPSLQHDFDSLLRGDNRHRHPGRPEGISARH